LLVCRPVHPDTITDRFNRLVDRAGVERIRLHDARHTPPSRAPYHYRSGITGTRKRETMPL
jgi:hypothetical protein